MTKLIYKLKIEKERVDLDKELCLNEILLQLNYCTILPSLPMLNRVNNKL